MIHDIILRFLSAITGLDLPAASTNAVESDDLIFALIGGTVAVLGLVFGLMLLYGIKYRHGSDTSRGHEIQKSWRVEVTWTAATLRHLLRPLRLGRRPLRAAVSSPARTR